MILYKIYIFFCRTESCASHRMYNKLIDLLQSLGVGFLACQLDGVGVNIVQRLADALWYLDQHHRKFEARSIHIPEVFHPFQGFNEYKKQKRKAPPVRIHAGSNTDCCFKFNCLLKETERYRKKNLYPVVPSIPIDIILLFF